MASRLNLNTHQSTAGFHRVHRLMVCPRAFGYGELLHLQRPVSNRGPALGSAVHEAMAYHYSGHHWTEAFQGPEERWSYTIPEASAIMEAYLAAYPWEDFEVLAVEHELSVMIYGLLFTRRVDLIARMKRTGCARIIDHKTAGQLGKRKRGIHRDPSLWTQDIVGAACIEDQFGLPYEGVTVNLIETAKKKDAEGRDVHLFERLPIMPAGQMLRDSYASLHFWLKQAEEWANSGVDVWSMPQTWQCDADYGCDFLELCEYGPDALERFEVRR